MWTSTVIRLGNVEEGPVLAGLDILQLPEFRKVAGMAKNPCSCILITSVIKKNSPVAARSPGTNLFLSASVVIA